MGGVSLRGGFCHFETSTREHACQSGCSGEGRLARDTAERRGAAFGGAVPQRHEGYEGSAPGPGAGGLHGEDGRAEAESAPGGGEVSSGCFPLYR